MLRHVYHVAPLSIATTFLQGRSFFYSCISRQASITPLFFTYKDDREKTPVYKYTVSRVVGTGGITKANVTVMFHCCVQHHISTLLVLSDSLLTFRPSINPT